MRQIFFFLEEKSKKRKNRKIEKSKKSKNRKNREIEKLKKSDITFFFRKFLKITIISKVLKISKIKGHQNYYGKSPHNY